jgi:PAS domain-containing protein
MGQFIHVAFLYLLCAGLVALATFLTWLLPPLKNAATLMLFVAPVLLSMWLGGLRMANVAMILSIAAWVYFILPRDQDLDVSRDSPLIRAAAFVLVCGIALSFYSFFLKKRLESFSREERLRDAFVSATMGVLDYHSKKGECWFSRELQRMLGSPDSVAPSFGGYLSFVHPGDRPVLLKMMTLAHEGDTEFELTHRALRRDGSLMMIKLRGKLIVDQAGTLDRMIAVATDVTDKRWDGTEKENA